MYREREPCGEIKWGWWHFVYYYVCVRYRLSDATDAVHAQHTAVRRSQRAHILEWLMLVYGVVLRGASVLLPVTASAVCRCV